MYIQLLVWNRESCVLEGVFHVFEGLPANFPVIIHRHPEPDSDVYRGTYEIVNEYIAFIILSSVDFFYGFTNDFFCLFDVIVIGNTKHQVYHTLVRVCNIGKR